MSSKVDCPVSDWIGPRKDAPPSGEKEMVPGRHSAVGSRGSAVMSETTMTMVDEGIMMVIVDNDDDDDDDDDGFTRSCVVCKE